MEHEEEITLEKNVAKECKIYILFLVFFNKQKC